MFEDSLFTGHILNFWCGCHRTYPTSLIASHLEGKNEECLSALEVLRVPLEGIEWALGTEHPGFET